MKLRLLTALLLCSGLLSAQQPVVTRVTAFYDTTAVAELFNRVPIGLEISYNNGQTRYTEGFADGDYRWRHIKVSSPDGSFSNGYLTFNRAQLAGQQYKAKLLITLPDAAGHPPFEATLQLPYVTGIRFNHYADSLKRGIHFYLNVEGLFSSGKIYPLDTSAIRFETSAGRLLGQDLLLDAKDNAVKAITVKAFYKGQPSYQAESVIPVKQKPDDDSGVIDERDVFKKRKRN